MQEPSSTVIGYTSELDAADPVLRDVLEVWHAVRQGRRMARRQDMSPQLLRRHLGWIHLFDVICDPLDFRFRLYGSRIADILGHDATGQLLTETYRGSFLASLFSAFEALVTLRLPLLLNSSGAGANKDFLPIVSLMLPLSEDGEGVDGILVRHRIAGIDE